ncbi:hypothetical protein Q31b_30750 [Novipirellula aureliae]|uniref:Uncharacterized protein n=1 Tax=Novipirellula aureliae TaxID=2527966 RepID=A0A5C6E1U0_9BACT|nr:hypothetical protein Q31b_30750 [Novipirellula aureliae]
MFSGALSPLDFGHGIKRGWGILPPVSCGWKPQPQKKSYFIGLVGMCFYRDKRCDDWTSGRLDGRVRRAFAGITSLNKKATTTTRFGPHLPRQRIKAN